MIGFSQKAHRMEKSLKSRAYEANPIRTKQCNFSGFYQYENGALSVVKTVTIEE